MAVDRERVPALDGLRGLAILMVLFLHGIPYQHATSHIGQVFNGVQGLGWAGVDLFFVLSGFLITGILINSRSSKNYFRNFYARRTLRIFPLYYMIVFVSVVIGPRLFTDLQTRPATSAGWWWFYLSNVPYSVHPFANAGWLGFFWSLAVEEHFYLVWPILVLACSNRTLAKVCVGVVICAWLSRMVCAVLGAYHAGYALTPCRMDALAYGALVAIAVRSPNCRRFARPALPVAAGLIACAMVLLAFKHSSVWNGVSQLVTMPMVDAACALSVFAINVSLTGGPAILRSRALRLVGKYSYGMYVLHLPVADLAGPRIAPLIARITSFARLDDLSRFALLTGATYVVAFVVWHVFEMPFMRLKRFFPQSHAVPLPKADEAVPARLQTMPL